MILSIACVAFINKCNNYVINIFWYGLTLTSYPITSQSVSSPAATLW